MEQELDISNGHCADFNNITEKFSLAACTDIVKPNPHEELFLQDFQVAINLSHEYRIKIIQYRIEYDYRVDKSLGQFRVMLVGGREICLSSNQCNP